MKRREFLASMGGLVLASPLAISACGNTSTGSATGNQKVTINWWFLDGQAKQNADWQNVAKQYMKAHPNVTIKTTIIENQAFKQKLATVMQAGQPPDIFHSWGGGILFNYAKAGLVKDLTPDLQGGWGDSFSQSALNVYAQNGHNWGVPWDMGGIAFYYNKDLFAKANITQLPTTWSQFLQVVQQLKSAGITPIALGEGDKWPGHYWWAYLATRIGGKAGFDAAATQQGAGFASQPFVEAGQRLQELIALKPFQKGFLGAVYNDEITAMGTGKAAMELMGQWAPAADEGQVPKGKTLNLGFFPFPMVEGGAGNPNDVFGGGGGYAVGKNAPQEAVDFLKFFTSVQVQRAFGKAGYLTPVVKGASDALTNPLLRDVQNMVAHAPYFQLYYDQYFPPAIANAVLDGTQALYAGTTTPQAVAQQVQAAAATALQGS